MTDTLLPPIVQSVAAALANPMTALVAALGRERLLNRRDRALAHRVLEGARRALERALTDTTVAPAEARRDHAHSALGPLSFVVPAGRFDATALVHGCTWRVREECAFFLAQGTAQEAHDALAKFRPTVPRVSTIKRVRTHDGAGMMRVWDGQTAALTRALVTPLADRMDLVSASADGACVPMRGLADVAAREYHEARVVTVTLFGRPEPTRERTVTLHARDGEPYKACVGDLRPRLATLVFGDMPCGDGPKGDRAVTALGTVLDTIRTLVPDVTIRRIADGGPWPAAARDAAIPKRHRTTDFYHATEHLHTTATLAFGDTAFATTWYQRERTRLLTDDGAARALVASIAALAARPGLRTTTREALETEAGFVRKRLVHMRDAALLRDDLPIGSGIVEAAVKRLITLRMKRPGATWTEEGGDAIIALRSLRLSSLWDEAWRHYAAAQGANRGTNAA